MYSRQENNFIIQPTPISDQFSYGPNGDIPAQLLLPPTSPFYPHDPGVGARASTVSR